MPKGSVGIEFLNLNMPEWKAQVQSMSKFMVDSFTVSEKAAVASSDRVTKARKKANDEDVASTSQTESKKQKIKDDSNKKEIQSHESKDQLIKNAIASRVKYEQDIEGKEAKELERLVASTAKEYDLHQRAMQLSTDKRIKAELRAEMQADQERLKILRARRNELEGSSGKSLYGSAKSAIGSNAAEAAALIGVDLTVAGMMRLGQEVAKVDGQMKAAFRTAGASSDQASSLAKQATADAGKWSDAIGITELRYKQLSKEAAIAGGFLGDVNKQLVVAAAAIEKETSGKEGEITADRFIRGISAGVNSEEGSNVIGQLRKSMPLLAAELANATSKEDLFNRAIKFTNESVKNQIDWLNTEDGALEREQIRRENQVERVSKLTNNWIGAILNAAKNIDVTLDETLGTLDAHDAEERKIMEAHVAQLEKDLKREKDLHGANVQSIENMLASYKKELAADDKASSSANAHTKELEKQAFAAKETARSIDSLVLALDAELNADNEVLRRARASFVDADRMFQKWKGTPYGALAKLDLDRSIAALKEAGGVVNAIQGEFDKADTIAGRADNKGKDVNKSTFDKRKAILEDQMRGEQTLAELNGILLNKTKEQIEIESLNIEIKYSYAIAKAAEKNAQLKNEYLLKAAKDEERIREINAGIVKRIEEEFNKNQEIHFRFELSTQDKYGKERMELRKKFWEEFNTLTDPKAIIEVTQMAQKAEAGITQEENDEKLKKENEYQSKFLSVQMKGIETRIKTNKKDSSTEISLEDERYNKALDIQKNYYSKAILEAKADEKLLQIARLENNEVEKNLLLEHLDNLKKITDSANQEMKDLAKQTTESVFDPITQSMNNAIATMPKFVQILIGGLEKILANKAANAIADLLFPSKKKSDVTNTGTPEQQSGGGSWIENNIPSFGEGGYTGDGTGTFLAKLHRGEVVIPPDIVAMIKGESPQANLAHPWTEIADSSTATDKDKEDNRHKRAKQDEINRRTVVQDEYDADEDNTTSLNKAKLLQDKRPIAEQERDNARSMYNPDSKSYWKQMSSDASSMLEMAGTAGTLGLAAEGDLLAHGIYSASKHLLEEATIHAAASLTEDLGEGKDVDLTKMVESAIPGRSLGKKLFGVKEGETPVLPLAPGDKPNADGTVDATASGTEKGMINAAKILQGASKGKNGNMAAGIVGAGEAALNIAVPGLGSVLGALGGIFGFADGGVYDPHKPRIVGETGPEIDYNGMIIPIGKRRPESASLSAHLADMAGRSAYAGGSSGGRNNDVALLREMQNNTRSVNNLHSAIRDGSVTTRQVQLGNRQDSLRHSTSKY